MSIAFVLLQANNAEIPEFLKQIGITSVEALLVTGGLAIVVLVVVLLLLRFLTMWWFGVTTMIERLDRVISKLEALEKSAKKEEF